MTLPTNVRKFAQRINAKVIDEVLYNLDTTSLEFQISDNLRRINEAFSENESYKIKFFSFLSFEDCKRIVKNSSEIGYIQYLAKNRLLPLKSIMKLSEVGILGKSLEDIKDGKFDRQNEIHLELEYSKGTVTNNFNDKFEQFQKLPYFDENGEIMDPHWKTVAYKTAKDAIVALDYIVSLSIQEQNTLVFGNSRYGYDYIVEPCLEYYLKAGIKVKKTHISSKTFWLEPGTPSLFGTTLNNEFQDKKPNIFFVDGTVHKIGENGLTRFPSSVCGLIRGIDEFNSVSEKIQYLIRFWSPTLTENIYTGEVGYVKFPDSKADNARNFTFVSSTQNSDAYFDDPEDCFLKYTKAKVFTRYGLEIRDLKFDEKRLTTLWKGLVKEEVEKLMSSR